MVGFFFFFFLNFVGQLEGWFYQEKNMVGVGKMIWMRFLLGWWHTNDRQVK
jgi:hypothetical protein